MPPKGQHPKRGVSIKTARVIIIVIIVVVFLKVNLRGPCSKHQP